MNSCLYECVVMHHRLAPKKHRFVYKLFMFYLDLDELEEISRRMMLVSRNRFNIFSFHGSDHIQFGKNSVKENLSEYLTSKGVDPSGMRVFLLTHLRTFGHIFNPVSFYFCFDESGKPVCAVPEVGNTFGEMKAFFIGANEMRQNTFRHEETKYFYVSPFVDLDTRFDFQLRVPDEKLDIRIDDIQNAKKFLLSSLVGNRKELSDRSLIWYSVRFPFITMKVITLIHWQAFLLYLKKLPYHKKSHNLHLQQEVYNAKSN
jgi:uncharacterized protein